MLCVSIRPQTEEELLADFALAAEKADLVEVRVDGFKTIPFDILKKLFKKPTLLSIGALDDAPLLRKLAALGPTWLDVPSTIPIIPELKIAHTALKIICSYHDYEKTPDNLQEIFHALQMQGADLVKLVTYANRGLDGLQLLHFLRLQKTPIASFCMGECGAFTRVLAPVFGGAITYSCLPDKPTAPGQVSCDELLSIYRFRKLSPKTKPFALIGKPITQSPSFITHNAVFEKIGLNAVYVKIPLGYDEAQEGMHLLETLGFAGLSVTHPLKAAITDSPYNTVSWKDGTAHFLNTDGKGLLDAIETHGSIKGKKVILIGAGSTAQAIALEAKKRGACLTITNRTEAKAYLMAKLVDCDYFSWNLPHLLATPYDVLINATTVGMKGDRLPLSEQHIRKESIVADVILNAETPLLQMANSAGAKVVTGYEMWFRQAAYQFCFWKEELHYEEVLSWLKASL